MDYLNALFYNIIHYIYIYILSTILHYHLSFSRQNRQEGFVRSLMKRNGTLEEVITVLMDVIAQT